VKDFKEELGIRIRTLRDKAGLSLSELEAESGIPKATISRIENGHRNPRIETLKKIAEGIGVELKELFELENE
jgi:transcriptional regulator with XRE-family HTH domain